MRGIRQPAGIEEPIHVIHGLSAAGSLKQCGGKELVVLHDPLFPGPCHANPKIHRRLRQAYLSKQWTWYDGANAELYRDYRQWVCSQLYSAKQFASHLGTLMQHRNIVLWTTVSWPDRLAFWWMLDALSQRRPLDINKIWVAEPALWDDFDPEQYHPLPTLGTFPPNSYRGGFQAIRPLTENLLNAGSQLWREFARTSPSDFDGVSEAAWVQGALKQRFPYDAAKLKKDVYGTDRPGLQLETARMVEEASRLVGELADLVQMLPIGFDALASAVQSWK